MNVLSIKIESDFTLCWSQCCGWLLQIPLCYEQLTALARSKIITKKDRWLRASRCWGPHPTLALSTCIHHRVLDSSGLEPSHQDAKGRGRSHSLSVTDSYFWGRPDMLGLMKHSTDISAVTAHLTFIRLLLPEFLFFSFLVPRTHVNTREVILVSFRNGSRKCNFPKFLISKFNGHSLFCIISLLFQFYMKNKTLLHLLTFSR